MNVVTRLWMFVHEFDRKMKEKLQDSLHLIWSLKYNIQQDCPSICFEDGRLFLALCTSHEMLLY